MNPKIISTLSLSLLLPLTGCIDSGETDKNTDTSPTATNSGTQTSTSDSTSTQTDTGNLGSAPTISPMVSLNNNVATFSANALDADGDSLSYFWDFNDGVTSNEMTPSHSFPQSNADVTYNVTLTVSDTNNQLVTQTISLLVPKKAETVANTAPVLTPTFSISNKQDVSFASNASDIDNDALTYFWDFGDGTTSTDESPMHSYAQSTQDNTYSVVVRVTDSNNQSTSKTLTVVIDKTVETNPTNALPTASINANKISGTAPLTVDFNSNGSSDTDGNIDEYIWEINGQSISVLDGFSHTFNSAGAYAVTLIVIDNQGAQSSKVTQNITVQASTPTQGETKLQHFEFEDGVLLDGYSSITDSPFNGVTAYADGDGVQTTALLSVESGAVPGEFRLDIRGASSNTSAAGISVYLGDELIGATSFSGSEPSTSEIDFKLKSNPTNDNIRFVLENDNGSNDTLLDWFELHRTGDVLASPSAPIPPSEGAYYTGNYRNMFAEFGFDEAEIEARLQATYDQLFHSTDLENEALFIPVGDDMAYIWDKHNDDVRSEGMSYGMMMAVQMDRQDDFNKLWKWANTYSLNTDNEMKGYFAWQVSTEGVVIDKNPAPDGEEYFVMALFFASHRWGDDSGIYDYNAQANKLLDDMFDNGQKRSNGEDISLFYHPEKQIIFSPAMSDDRTMTDPSYHLPAFYELWARWADNNNEFWAELAVTSRNFWKTTVDEETGLNPDYAYFNGDPHGEQDGQKIHFQYDAWRTIANAGMDYSWWSNDPWQTTWANRLQDFFVGKGIKTYGSLYELNGNVLNFNTDHSPGLVAMNAVGTLASDQENAWEFVENFWETGIPTGRYRYYDGCLYMFGMLAMSGQYKIYCPNGVCDDN